MLLSRSLKSAVLGVAVLGPVLLPIGLLAGCDRQSGGNAQPEPSASASAAPAAPAHKGQIDRSQKGSVIPDLTVANQQGKTLALPALKGKPLLVNLWATWCAPCVAELPTLDKLAGARAEELRVVTVSQDMSGTEKVADFLKTRGGSHLEPWLDPKNDLAFHYQAGTLPTTILYDAQGKEVWRYVGGHDWSGAGAAALIAEALPK